MATSSLPQPVGAGAPVNDTIPKASRRKPVDLASIPTVPFAWVDEHVYAAIRGSSVKVIQRERHEGKGCRYKKINGTTVRYKIADIMAFLEAQPGGGASSPAPPARRGRPREVA
jgi:hypothetical protein